MSIRNLVENLHVVEAFAPQASPAGSEDYVSLKGAQRCAIILHGDNGTTVTGATVTVKQASDVSATGEKALAFTTYYANAATGTSDTFVSTTASSNTFTTTTTNNANWIYVIQIDASDLDTDNNFDCVRVDVTGNANCVLGGLYVLEGLSYAGGLPRVSATTD